MRPLLSQTLGEYFQWFYDKRKLNERYSSTKIEFFFNTDVPLDCDEQTAKIIGSRIQKSYPNHEYESYKNTSEREFKVVMIKFR